MSWKNSFSKGKELVLSTCSGDKPNANIAVSLGFHEGKLLVADCQMRKTIANLKANGKVCIVGGYLRLNGTAELSTSGKLFDICVKESKEYEVKTAIAINVESVFDLDKAKEVEI